MVNHVASLFFVKYYYICLMTIPEIKIHVSSHGGQAMDRKDIVWHLIFDMYKRSTGNRLSTGCGSCYKRAYRWLQNQ